MNISLQETPGLSMQDWGGACNLLVFWAAGFVFGEPEEELRQAGWEQCLLVVVGRPSIWRGLWRSVCLALLSPATWKALPSKFLSRLLHICS